MSSVSATYAAAHPEAPADSARREWLAESPAFREYVGALKAFDATLRDAASTGVLDIERALAEESLGDTAFAIVHLARMATTTPPFGSATSVRPR